MKGRKIVTDPKRESLENDEEGRGVTHTHIITHTYIHYYTHTHTYIHTYIHTYYTVLLIHT